jgi:nucleotide-binding universal stress UspA family protein
VQQGLSRQPQTRRTVVECTLQNLLAPMLKRILVLIDDTASSQAARRYALRLARHTNASLMGLAGIDLTFIEAGVPGRAGAASYKANLEERLRIQTKQINSRFQEIFEAECKAGKIAYEWQAFEGDPVAAICSAAAYCDLVITGHDTAYRGNISERLSDTVTKFVQLSPRPTVVCADDLSDSDRMMIAYDDSLSALRAAQLFALLGMGVRNALYVTAVGTNHDEATRRIAAISSYLTLHGYRFHENPIETDVAVAKALNDEVRRLNVETLVMGAYGHNRLRHLLFGSTTTNLLATPPCAIFIYH